MHVIPEFVFCVAVCDVVCVGCCIILRVIQIHRVTVVCTVKKISPSDTKFFLCAVIY